MRKWLKNVLAVLGIILFSTLMHSYFIWNDIYYSHSGGDPVDQYLKYQWFLYENIRDMNFEWSWLHGLGGDLYGEFAYYYMTSPFFLLNLLFNYDYLLQMVDIKLYISLLKVTLSGVFFYGYMQYCKKSIPASLLGVLLYIGSIQLTKISFYSDFMADAFVFLPLAVWGLDKLVREKKPLFFILAVFLFVQSNFYFAYITTIYLILYTLVVYFVRSEKKSVKGLFSFGWPIAASYVCGMLLAFYSFLPAVYQFLDAYRFSKVYEIPLLFEAKFYINLPTRIFFKINSYTIPSIFLLVILSGLWMRKKAFKVPLVMASGMFLFYLIPQMYSVFNGFSAIQLRWYYLILFALAVLAVYIADEWMSGQTVKRAGYFIYYAALIYALCTPEVFELYKENQVGHFLLIVHIVTPLVFLVKNTAKRKWAVMAAVALVFSQSIAASNVSFTKQQGEPETFKKYVSSQLEEVRHEDKVAVVDWLKNYDPGFYRVQWYVPQEALKDKWFDFHNDSMIYNIPSTAIYQSLLSKNIGKFIYEDQRILQFDSFSHFYNVDERPILQSYLQAKYMMVPGGLPYKPKGYTFISNQDPIKVYQLNDTLPFAYVEENRISAADYKNLTAAKREEALIHAYMSEEGETNFDPVDTLQSEVIVKDVENIPEMKKLLKDGLLIVPSKTSFKIPLDRVPSHEEELLFSVDIEEVKGKSFVIKAGSKELQKRAVDNTYSLPIQNFVMHLDEPFTEPELMLTLTKGTYKITDLMLERIPLDVLQQQAAEARASEYSLDRMIKSYVELTGSNAKEGMLITSIPYSSGWEVKVDGEKVETEEINHAFVGVYLEKGEHLVQFEYDTPFLRTGMLISLTTALGVIFIYFIAWKRNRNVKNIEQ